MYQVSNLTNRAICINGICIDSKGTIKANEYTQQMAIAEKNGFILVVRITEKVSAKRKTKKEGE